MRREIRLGILAASLGAQLAWAQADTLATLNRVEPVRAAPTPAIADSTPPPSLVVAGLPVLAAAGATFVYFQFAWWNEEATRFHFDTGRDLQYALNLDKLAHFTGGAITAEAAHDAFSRAGYSPNKSAWLAAGTSIGMHLVVEVKDGFSPNWGFSPVDMAAGTLGAFYPLAQLHSPLAEHSTLKVSYWRHSDRYFQRHPTGSWTNDYSNQVYWISFDVKHLVPALKSSPWPAFLDVSLGAGVDLVNSYGNGHHELYLGLDVDLVELLPGSHPVLKTLKKYLNYVKVPAPTLRLAPRLKVFPVYW